MTRIKGANSDYQYRVGADGKAGIAEMARAVVRGGKEVKEWTEKPLFLEIFLCPYDQPSLIEAPADTPKPHKQCRGLDETCPHPGDAKGHARVHLSEETGVTLSAGGASLRLDQSGTLTLSPRSRAVIEHGLELRDELRLRTAAGQQAAVRLGADGSVSVEAGGAVVTIGAGGAITLRPAAGQAVRAEGNLAVAGALSVTGGLQLGGDLTMTPAALAKLKQALG